MLLRRAHVSIVSLRFSVLYSPSSRSTAAARGALQSSNRVNHSTIGAGSLQSNTAMADTAAASDMLPTPLVGWRPAFPPLPSATSATITEGSASILFAGVDAVFYNKVQVLNRDMSALALRTYIRQRDSEKTAAVTPDNKEAQTRVNKAIRKAWIRLAAAGQPLPADLQASEGLTTGLHAHGKADLNLPAGTPFPGIRVLEALSASGLRSVRYSYEIPGIDTLVVNDLDPAAVASIRTNLAFNGLSASTQGSTDYDGDSRPVVTSTTPGPARPRVIVPSEANAVTLMQSHGEDSGALPFDVIDIDPYGTATPFIPAALGAVADGGMLCITCTDMSVLAGSHMDACPGKYGALPLRTRYYHEMALRMVLAMVEAEAVKLKRIITPVLSLAMDFYVRIFVRVHTSPRESTYSPTRIGHMLQCAGCDAFWLWPNGKWPLPRETSKRKLRKEQGPRPKPNPEEIAAARAAKAASTSRDHGVRVPAVVGERGGEERRREEEDEETEAEAAPAVPSSHAFTTSFNSRVLAARMGMNGANHVHANFAPPFSVCPCCDRPLHMGGPVWLDPIHEPAFVKEMLASAEASFGTDGMGIPGAISSPDVFYDLAAHPLPRPPHDAGSNNVDTVATSRRRLLGLLRGVVDELHDVPMYYEIKSLISRLHLRPMPTPVLTRAIRSAGFRTSETHALPGCLKTDAPPGFLWDILRAWEAVEGNGTSARYRDAHATIAHRILHKPAAYPHLPIIFPSEEEVRHDAQTRKSEGARHVSNPGVEWGPGSRASAGKAAAVAAGVSVSNAVKVVHPTAKGRGRPAATTTAAAGVEEGKAAEERGGEKRGEEAPPGKRPRTTPSPTPIEASVDA